MASLSASFRIPRVLALIAACCAGTGCSNLGDSRGPVPAATFGSNSRIQTQPGNGADYKLLYNFKGGLDGYWPTAGLLAAGKSLYGTTAWGGQKCEGSSGCGAVFKLDAPTESLIHSFGGGKDGKLPQAGLIAVDGDLYGMTSNGGSRGYGIAFRLTPSGSTYKESIIYTFNGGSDGTFPTAEFVELKGVLYGTTSAGGNFGYGTIFKLAPAGSKYKETVLRSFKGGTDGAAPGGLVVVGDSLFGITTDPLSSNSTVFKIGSSGGAYSVLHRFKGGTLTSLIAEHGVLFGTQAEDGPGAVFSLRLSGSGFTTLYSFKGSPSDGFSPSTLIAVNGSLYGTTLTGGRCPNPDTECGTVFALKRAGSAYKESIIYDFAERSNGGSNPISLLFESNALYGTTEFGGFAGACGIGCGTIYKLTLKS